MPTDLYGPFGLLIALGIAVGALWRDHQRQDKERVTDLTATRDTAISGWREQTAATERLTDALEAQSRRRTR